MRSGSRFGEFSRFRMFSSARMNIVASGFSGKLQFRSEWLLNLGLFTLRRTNRIIFPGVAGEVGGAMKSKKFDISLSSMEDFIDSETIIDIIDFYKDDDK